MITQARVREALRYDAETGIFTWRINMGKMHTAGRVAGRTNSKWGFVTVGLDGREYKAHRLAWLYVYGDLPAGEIDHVNNDPADNRLSNIRLATASQNQGNKRRQRNNVSGFKGVSWNSARKKWVAQIKIHGRQTCLGRFDRPEDAHAAYCAAAVGHFGEFARTE